jgi:hypothetical protein
MVFKVMGVIFGIHLVLKLQAENENLQDQIGVSREVSRSYLPLQADTKASLQGVQCQDEGKTR